MTTFENVTVSDVLDVLRRHDPVALHSIGAPLDEYTVEAEAIHARLNDDCELETLLITVYSVFVYYFDPTLAGHVNNYRDITQDIMLLKGKPKPKPPQLKLVVSNEGK